MNVSFSKKPSETGGLSDILSIAVGARVMVTVNINVSDGLVNGVFGTVVAFDGAVSDSIKHIFVTFDDTNIGKQAIQKCILKHHGTVPISRQSVSFLASKRSPLNALRCQFPLTLAWACTIHKVQGKTLNKVVVSLKKQIFLVKSDDLVCYSQEK